MHPKNQLGLSKFILEVGFILVADRIKVIILPVLHDVYTLILINETYEYIWLHCKGEIRLLISWPQNGEITSNYPTESNVITRVFKNGREKLSKSQNQRETWL